MNIIKKIDNFWRQIDDYQKLKELFYFFKLKKDKEKKKYAECILDWAISGNNMDPDNPWKAQSAVDECKKRDSTISDKGVMQQTFGLMRLYGFAKLDQNREEIRFTLDGLEVGKMLSKKRSTVLWYEFILSLSWLVSALTFTALYLEVMQKIGILDDLKRIVIEYNPCLKDVWAIILVFILPLLFTLLLFFRRFSVNNKIFMEVRNES